jgi:hypothetical protein
MITPYITICYIASTSGGKFGMHVSSFNRTRLGLLTNRSHSGYGKWKLAIRSINRSRSVR